MRDLLNIIETGLANKEAYPFKSESETEVAYKLESLQWRYLDNMVMKSKSETLFGTEHSEHLHVMFLNTALCPSPLQLQ